VTSLSSEYPTLAFHASLTNPFGKGALINTLRQFSKVLLNAKKITCFTSEAFSVGSLFLVLSFCQTSIVLPKLDMTKKTFQINFNVSVSEMNLIDGFYYSSTVTKRISG
jgi:hypothetical protein